MNDLEKILESCIEKRRKAGLSIEEVLKDHTQEQAEEIRPLLELSEELGSLPDPVPSPGATFKIMAEIVSTEKSNSKHAWRFLQAKGMLRLAASFVVILFLGLGSVYASSQTLPGDLLYPLKKLTEKVRFFLTANDKNKAELRLVFSDKRLAEAIRKHQQDKEIDPELLEEMLNEAKKALLYSSKLDAEDKKDVVSLLDRTTLHQRNEIEDLYKKASPNEQKILSPYLCVCNHRCKMMKNILTDMNLKSASDIQDSCMPESSILCGCKEGKPCKKSRAEVNIWKDAYPSASKNIDEH